MDAYDRYLALEADRSTLYPPTVPSKSPRRCSLRRPVSVRWRSRSRDRNARSERRRCLCVMRVGRVDDIMAEKARERHLFVFRLSTLAAVVRPPSEAVDTTHSTETNPGSYWALPGTHRGAFGVSLTARTARTTEPTTNPRAGWGGGVLLKVGGVSLKLYSAVSCVYPDVS